jgi:hypothetical protein
MEVQINIDQNLIHQQLRRYKLSPTLSSFSAELKNRQNKNSKTTDRNKLRWSVEKWTPPGPSLS